MSRLHTCLCFLYCAIFIQTSVLLSYNHRALRLAYTNGCLMMPHIQHIHTNSKSIVCARGCFLSTLVVVSRQPLKSNKLTDRCTGIARSDSINRTHTDKWRYDDTCYYLIELSGTWRRDVRRLTNYNYNQDDWPQNSKKY